MHRFVMYVCYRINSSGPNLHYSDPCPRNLVPSKAHFGQLVYS
ncbi:unnamed protein product [Periconia digitata]|uniref:Uncharacterized protein n=1 Tax=Periconia digitata TaxID=1303443 RepID=A0A9W4USD8_9PLEO|nr:unnamed protein product [Periconia digitata]